MLEETSEGGKTSLPRFIASDMECWEVSLRTLPWSSIRARPEGVWRSCGRGFSILESSFWVGQFKDTVGIVVKLGRVRILLVS